MSAEQYIEDIVLTPFPADQYVDIGVCESTNVPMRICYNTFGDSANPCVLLISGRGASLLVWEDPFCQMIADKGYYLIRYDNRDVGLSTHLDELPPPAIIGFGAPECPEVEGQEPWYTLNDMAKDGMKLLTALGIEKAHVVGASMGGMIAQCMAIQFPERVLSLNIIYSHSGGASVTMPPVTPSEAASICPKSNAIEDVVEFKMGERKKLLGKYDIPDEVLKDSIVRNLHRYRDDKAGIARQLWAVRRAECRDEQLKLLACPTVIFHGRQDTLIPSSNGVHLFKLIPNAKLVLYPNMGHTIPAALHSDMVEHMEKNFQSAPTAQ